MSWKRFRFSWSALLRALCCLSCGWLWMVKPYGMISQLSTTKGSRNVKARHVALSVKAIETVVKQMEHHNIMQPNEPMSIFVCEHHDLRCTFIHQNLPSCCGNVLDQISILLERSSWCSPLLFLWEAMDGCTLWNEMSTFQNHRIPECESKTSWH